MQTLTEHAYYDAVDYWRVREFLRQVFLLNHRREIAWPLLRWDYWRWHGQENIEHFPDLAEVVRLWQMPGGGLAAVLTPEGQGEAFLHLHPAAHGPALLEEMLRVAEARLATAEASGERRLTVWAPGTDAALQALLAARGYTRQDGAEHQRRQDLTGPITPVPAPPGYTVRALGDESEHPARSWASWRAFHPNDPPERYQGHAWYANVQRGPLYRRDLDIVAVAPDGTHAAFCTCWLDDVCRTVTFEPVGTVPEHQKRGLGKAVMTEALRRAQRLGANRAHVGGYSVRANALYASVGFTDYNLSEPWLKVFRA